MFDASNMCIFVSHPHESRERAAAEAFSQKSHMNACTTAQTPASVAEIGLVDDVPVQHHKNPFPYNRFADAHNIWHGGACNIAGIARALVKAADAARVENVQPSEDLAVRAIVAQLASLCRVDNLGSVHGVPFVADALDTARAESLKVAA
jgi:hypothetical protein